MRVPVHGDVAGQWSREFGNIAARDCGFRR
jgi:hypothetical protein